MQVIQKFVLSSNVCRSFISSCLLITANAISTGSCCCSGGNFEALTPPLSALISVCRNATLCCPSWILFLSPSSPCVSSYFLTFCSFFSSLIYIFRKFKAKSPTLLVFCSCHLFSHFFLASEIKIFCTSPFPWLLIPLFFFHLSYASILWLYHGAKLQAYHRMYFLNDP